MGMVTIGYGALLMILGLVGFFATGASHPTALIPLFFGVPLVVLGALAAKNIAVKHVMHAAALLAVLGLFGTLPGVLKLGKLVNGTAERPVAVAAQAIMALLSAMFIVLAVRSFILARKRRRLEATLAATVKLQSVRKTGTGG